MAFDDPSTIDLLSCSADGSEATMIVVATEAWSAKTVRQLERKLSAHLDYATDGRLARAHPQTSACRLVVRLEHYEPLSPAAEATLTGLAETIAAAGVGLVSEQASWSPFKLIVRLFRKTEPRIWA